MIKKERNPLVQIEIGINTKNKNETKAGASKSNLGFKKFMGNEQSVPSKKNG